MGYTQNPYLNLGCGKVTLPAPRPAHHELIPEGVHDYPLWRNVDLDPLPGVDQTFDLFEYPWPLAENAFDGAILSHIVEHIPHGGRSEGFYDFFAELHRVLTPGSVVHIVAPFAFSTGAVQDPTHTRYLVPETFGYLEHDPKVPFHKRISGWRVEDVRFGLTDLSPNVSNDPVAFHHALRTQWNIAQDFYVRLRCVK